MQNLNILIKPASEKCNMKCTYCFYHDISSKREIKDYGFMTYETSHKIIDRIFEVQDLKNITIGFQGGEPTLIGIDFFKDFIAYINKKLQTNKININYSLQTNALYLPKEFISLFKKHNFLIGVSLDGIQSVHDKYRVDLGNNKTYLKVMNNIKILEKNNINYNILTVINKDSSKNVKAIYNNFKKHNFKYIQFIPCLDPIYEENGKQRWSLSPEQYFIFLDSLFKLWLNDIAKQEVPLNIRLFNNILLILLNNEPESCDMRGICSIQNVIEADGSVYPCDFFVFEKKSIGNIQENSFENMYKSEVAINFLKDSLAVPSKCKKCSYYKLCRNGCTRNRVLKNNQLINYYCDTYYSFYQKNIKELLAITTDSKKLNTIFKLY